MFPRKFSFIQMFSFSISRPDKMVRVAGLTMVEVGYSRIFSRGKNHHNISKKWKKGRRKVYSHHLLPPFKSQCTHQYFFMDVINADFFSFRG